MTILTILQYPDLKLKRVAKPVENFGSDLQKIVEDMFETHYNADNCAALAATQLDMEPWSITVIDFSPEKNSPLCLINPKIIDSSGEQIEMEGCMSVYPNFLHEKVKRSQNIKVQAQDRSGAFFEMHAEGFMAKCIQHEIDHLHGILYIDRLSKIKKERVQNKIKRILRKL